MSIDTPEELEQLKAAGRVVAAAIRAMRKAVRPGVSTKELDQVGAAVFREAGARSGPQLDYGFPGVNCISVNDEAVHGIPGRRRLQGGDLVKLDVTAELDGFYADACVSVPGRQRASLNPRSRVRGAGRSLRGAARVARPGTPLNAIGQAVETTVADRGYAVCPALIGHGIGRRIHEAPDVLNHFVPGPSPALDRRAGDHDRADHLGRRRLAGPGRRRLDDLHRRRSPVGPRRAHDRHHRRSPDHPHRLAVRGLSESAAG